MDDGFKWKAQEDKDAWYRGCSEHYERLRREKEEESRRRDPSFDGVCIGPANSEDLRIASYLAGLSRNDLVFSFTEIQIRPKYAQLYVEAPIAPRRRMYNPGCGCAFCKKIYCLLEKHQLDPDLNDLKAEQTMR